MKERDPQTVIKLVRQEVLPSDKATVDSGLSTDRAMELKRVLARLAPSLEISDPFAFESLQVFESYFRENPIALRSLDLKPLKGKCKNFSDQTRDLTRPYFAISKDDFSVLFDHGQADFYLSGGGLVLTFGEANGGYALMPLLDEPAKQILSQQGV